MTDLILSDVATEEPPNFKIFICSDGLTLDLIHSTKPGWDSHKKIVLGWVKNSIGRYPVIVVVIEIMIVKGVTLPEEGMTELEIVEEAFMT